MEKWIIEEFSSLDLGDKRLNNRTKKILSNLSKSPLSSIPTCSKGWHETKAAYRCFSNPKLDSKKILAPHKQATLERVQVNKRVLVLQDTTDLNYSGQSHKQGVGPTHHGTERALLLHPCLVVNESGCCLGVYDDYQWHRSELLSRKTDKNTLNNERLHKKHISEKESYRWVLGYRKATELAKEINTPEGEEPVIWWLMTSVPMAQLQPSQLILWYLCRWQIEVFFKILKSGCQVEQLQLETANRTKNCLAIYLIIAWRILFLTSLAKSEPDVVCTTILDKSEWETAWIIVKQKIPPKAPPSLKEAIVLIAKMGGYLARKNDAPPGPKAIWQGITQLYHSIHAIEIAKKTYG